MRIAVTIINESGRISPLFEAAGLVMLVDCAGGVILSELALSLPVLPDGKIAFLSAHAVEVLLCGAIANETAELVVQHGIQLQSFATGQWREVLSDLQSCSQLRECHLMPGCRCQCRHYCPKKHHSGVGNESSIDKSR